MCLMLIFMSKQNVNVYNKNKMTRRNAKMSKLILRLTAPARVKINAPQPHPLVPQQIECYFSTLIYMLSLMSTVTKLQSAVSKVLLQYFSFSSCIDFDPDKLNYTTSVDYKQVVDLLLGGKEYAPLRLKMLQTSYNAIPVTPVTAPLSRRIFFGVLNYAAENELFHVLPKNYTILRLANCASSHHVSIDRLHSKKSIGLLPFMIRPVFFNTDFYRGSTSRSQELVPYLDTFEEWMGAWQQEEAQMVEDRKELYYLIATQIPLLKAEVKLSMSQVSEELSFKWMQKYLNIETEVNDRSKEAIAKFVREIVELPSVYEVFLNYWILFCFW